MNFFIAGITRRQFAPRYELSCSWWLWRRLLAGLRSRGRGVRESGAFLLGMEDSSGARRIADFLLYDDLDPHALDTGIIRLDGRHFGKLWEYCGKRGMTVIADVHTHPGSAGQSGSDRAHPIIAQAGHLALIVPNFAASPAKREELGIYRYGGAGQWKTIPAHRCREFFHIGIF
jgi:hypothetical protein